MDYEGAAKQHVRLARREIPQGWYDSGTASES